MVLARAAAAALVVLALGAPLGAGAAHLRATASESSPNPMRRIITMLQATQDKIGEEQVTEKELFSKYMCYCETSQATLEASIAKNTQKIPQVQGDIESASAQVSQLEEEIVQHRKDVKDAQASMAEATEIRTRNEEKFQRDKSDLETNIAALKKAVELVGKGMKGAFLQSPAADVLRRLVHLIGDGDDIRALGAFLSQGQGQGQGSNSTDAESFLQVRATAKAKAKAKAKARARDTDSEDYAPRSGEILGVMEQMQEEMEKDLRDAIQENEQQKSSYAQLMTAKGQEVSQGQSAIEQKMQSVSELKLLLVNLRAELKDATQSLKEDTIFNNDLKQRCADESDRWVEREKTRTAELGAIADTIRILNNDAAKEIFTKTMATAPSEESGADSFLQVSATLDRRRKALRAVRAARGRPGTSRFQMDLLALALRGKKVSFDGVVQMIDKMTALLLKEQAEDDKKRDFCRQELSTSGAEKDDTTKAIKDVKAIIAETKDSVKSLTAEIAELVAGIKTLDAGVAEATRNRQAEHKEFEESRASNAAAQRVLNVARARLAKFYDSEQYKAAQEKKTASFLGDAPPPPPTTFDGYKGQGDAKGGVLGLIDEIAVDLAREYETSKKAEAQAQMEYEEMIRDAKAKRAGDAKAMQDKQQVKAGAEETLHEQISDKKAKQEKLASIEDYLKSTHGECDAFLKKFKTVATARLTEADAMKNAKAILLGVAPSATAM